MRMRRKRKSTVRWLPDLSAFSQLKSHDWTSAGGIFETSIPLMAEAGGFSTSLDSSSPTINTARYSPGLESLIIDHIKGKVAWTILGDAQGESGPLPDATGIWMYLIGMAITFEGTASEPGTDTPAELSAGTTTIHSIDPGAVIPWINFGSQTPDGVRCVWRRHWMLGVDWSAGEAAINLETMSPPAGYIDIKPKRLLRPSEQLLLRCRATAFGTVAAEGNSRIFFGHDLRTAAHNTARRR